MRRCGVYRQRPHGEAIRLAGAGRRLPGQHENAEPDKDTEDKSLPELAEGQALPIAGAAVKEGKTTPPKHFTEDTLLSAMETAGKDDMPEDAERKGLGTPATRAGILEKLVSTGFLERKRTRKPCSSCRPTTPFP